MEDERKDKVRDHDFDGIQEFDNRLPNWWIGTFVLTVVFAVYYWTAHYTFGAKPTHKEEFEADMAELQKLQLEKGAGGPTDAEIAAMQKQPAELALGKQVFMTNCIACHGEHAQGVIGPNLTDHYWLHGGKPSQLGVTVMKGVPDKGMPTWKGVLGDAHIHHVVAYVVSLRDSHPASPKAPQGVLEP
jgi:cytochrome c oxidase cbb3-type subunit 3